MVCAGLGCVAKTQLMPPATKEISWHRVSPTILTQKCQGLDHYKGGILGCSWWTDKTCVIYTVDTLGEKSQQEQFVLGHEVEHCFNGKFHN
jgi:hypothetical protein